MKKLKPVIFVQGERSFSRNNLYSQNLLIKAMADGETSPKRLMKAAELRSVAEVYRTLDKISIRKEYHDALIKNGVDLDFIVSGISKIAKNEGNSPDVRLKGYNVLLKSLGLDKYDKAEEGGKSWEELIVQASEKEAAKKEEDKAVVAEIEDYEVTVPETPKDEKKRQETEREVGRQLYANDEDE